MCAPHQATVLPDCKPEEAAVLLAIAGSNASPTFLDIYGRCASPSNEVGKLLVAAARGKEILQQILRHPDTPEGGRLALDELREHLTKLKAGESLTPEAPAAGPKTCCGGH